MESNKQPVFLNMRLDPDTGSVIDDLAERFGLSRSAVIRQAVRRWAEAEGMVVPRTAPRTRGKAAA